MIEGAGFAPDQSEESSGLLTNLPSILWERRWLILVPLILCSIVAAAAAFLLPRSYRSSAVLLVESQDLPNEVLATPLNSVIDRRIAKIRQQILARPDLVGLIQENDLYNASAHAKPLSELVEKMRDATDISAVNADISHGQNGGNTGSIAFSLSYDYSRPDLAQLVAQTFVDRLLKLDASESQSQAQSGVRFLEDQQGTLQAQLGAVEGQINRITGQNGMALSNANSLNLMGMGSGGYEQQIASLQRENATLQSQTGSIAIERDPTVIAAEGALAAAKAQFSDDHPDVKLAERRLAATRTAAAALQTNAVSGTVQKQIAANNAMIGELERARASDAGRTAAVAAAQSRGPAIAQEISQLQSRAEQLRTDLGRVTTNLLNARSVAKLADEQRGERLTLIDPPVTPDSPTWPNRPLMIGGGIAAGAVIGLALALLTELLMRPIRSVAALTRLTGQPPLGVVSVLSRDTSRRQRWLRWPFRRKTAAPA